MEPARWERLNALFHDALAVPDTERRSFLDATCAGDPALLRDALALLEEDARGGSPLDRDVATLARDLIADPVHVREIGRYRLIDVVGEGGMGVVFRARREDLGSVVAIKVLRDASLSPSRRERFLNEQRTLAQLEHPSIARLFDADTLADGTPWFAMEYVEGFPLTEYCSTRGTSIPGRLELFRVVCEAVQHAHRHAVIHRDLKPSNIYVKPDGTVRLLDFGISKHLEDADAPIEQTRTGLRLLTPAYAAPEQIRGDRVAIETDIYALGVVLYELLADRLPFDVTSRTPAEALAIVTERDPERPSAAYRTRRHPPASDIARPAGRAAWADLDVLCLTAMHKDPHRRYRTVDALIRDIDHFLANEPLEARPDTMRYRMGKFVGRNRGRVLSAAAGLALVVGLVAFYTVQLAAQRSLAQGEAAKATQVAEYLIGLFEAGDPFGGDVSNPDARTLLARGLERAESLAGQPDVQAQMLDALGRVYTRLSDYERAEPLLHRALAIRRDRAGGSLDVAQSLASLALLHRFTADYDSAEAFIREALAIREQRLASDHPDIGDSLDELGIVLNNQGEYAEAETIHRQALELRRMTDGGSNLKVAHSLNNLAVTLANVGGYAAAEGYLHESIEIGRAVLGPDHASLASDLANLGVVLEIQGDFAGADSALSDAVRIKRLRLGADHYETAFGLSQLGGMLLRAGEHDRAEAHLREAREIEDRVLDAEHRNTAITRVHLAGVLQARGELDEAERLLREAITIFAASVGVDHELTATTRCELGRLLYAQDALDDAESAFRDCVSGLEAALPEDHDQLANMRSQFGMVLTRQAKFDEAEPLLVEGHERLLDRFGPNHPNTQAAQRRLDQFHEARAGRIEQ